MKKLNICVDIDGTMTDPYCWLDYANRYFNKNVKVEEIRVYEINEVMGVSESDFSEFYGTHGPEMHLNAPLRDNVENVLEQINRNHNIFYVTARDNRMTDATKKWFEANKLPKNKLYMLGSHYKVDKAKELGCDIFIEDRYENAVQLANEGIRVLLIDCNYNRFPLIDGITRVFSWDEILEKIKSITTVDIEDESEEIA